MTRLVGVLAALVVFLAGCGGGADDPSTGATPSDRAPSSAGPEVGRYVALGDSYTAAPYVYLTDVADGCFRSNANYPSLLAKSLGAASFEDVSCSGATTQDLLDGQTTGAGQRVPAQVDAIRSGTDLVTIGIGGNDNGLFGSLVGTCFGRPAQGATPAPGTCGQVDVTAARQKLKGLPARISALVDDVRERAPDAKVVLVGYPQIVAAGSTCDQLPLPEAVLASVDGLTRDLNAAVRQAAGDSDATFVDVYSASKGRDICGEDPWINGVDLDQQRAAPFHPFAAEQQAVADLVEQSLR